MAVIATYHVLPDKGVQMEVILTGGGVVLLKFQGESDMPCWCGKNHHYSIKCDVQTQRNLGGKELADIEQIIRGVDAAAQRLAWKILTQEVAKNSPCINLTDAALPFPKEGASG